MDPNATILLIDDAIDAGWFDDADEHAGNLRNWISRGGFAPDPSTAASTAGYITDTMEPLEDYPSLLWFVEWASNL